MASKSPPHIHTHHVFRQQTFPQGLLYHESRVAEVDNATFEVWREAALIEPSELLDGPAKAKLPVEHVQVAVGVQKTHVCAHEGNCPAYVLPLKRVWVYQCSHEEKESRVCFRQVSESLRRGASTFPDLFLDVCEVAAFGE